MSPPLKCGHCGCVDLQKFSLFHYDCFTSPVKPPNRAENIAKREHGGDGVDFSAPTLPQSDPYYMSPREQQRLKQIFLSAFIHCAACQKDTRISPVQYNRIEW
jgi:hypothetical protein